MIQKLLPEAQRKQKAAPDRKHRKLGGRHSQATLFPGRRYIKNGEEKGIGQQYSFWAKMIGRPSVIDHNSLPAQGHLGASYKSNE